MLSELFALRFPHRLLLLIVFVATGVAQLYDNRYELSNTEKATFPQILFVTSALALFTLISFFVDQDQQDLPYESNYSQKEEEESEQDHAYSEAKDEYDDNLSY